MIEIMAYSPHYGRVNVWRIRTHQHAEAIACALRRLGRVWTAWTIDEQGSRALLDLRGE